MAKQGGAFKALGGGGEAGKKKLNLGELVVGMKQCYK